MTVPAGWTTHVYDTEALPLKSTDLVRGAGGNQVLPSRLVGPVGAVLPVGIDILSRPFAEPVLAVCFESLSLEPAGESQPGSSASIASKPAI